MNLTAVNIQKKKKVKWDHDKKRVNVMKKINNILFMNGTFLIAS
jgi:hypothetical protein